MDYTPGAMRSAHSKDYKANWTNVMSIGTRTHQLALYVVFESDLQMLAYNPFNYLEELECAEFITIVPVTWDEIKVLDAVVGEYFVVARRKNNKWFIGAITNSKARDLSVKADFLKDGEAFTLTAFKDGINAGVHAMDDKKISVPVKKGDVIKISMVADGDYAASIE